jgi:hypothetical protein
MVGRIIDNIEYIELLFNNKLKSKSLEDNIYHTLRDIFWNCDEECDIIMTKKFNKILKNDDSFENSEYTDVLYDYCSEFTQELYEYLKNFTKDRIYFIEDSVEKNMNYIKLDDWCCQLQQLIKKLEEQLEKHKIWEQEDMDEDMNEDMNEDLDV